MHDDLFFVPLIDAALDQPDRQAALQAAFGQIRRMGQQRRYRRGYRQFLHWMQTAARAGLQAAATSTHDPTTGMAERPSWIEVIIELDDTQVARVRLDPAEPTIIGGIAPGSCRFRLDTGCVLWEGFISEQGELLSRREPGRPLRMAAATARPPTPRNEIRLLEGALTLRLRPDGSAWLLEIQPTRQKG
jgi:hypothetical protein